MSASCAAALIASDKPQSRESVVPKFSQFQPGVHIDWNARAVYADGRVVLREGSIEFLACFPGKEHESIVLLECTATNLYMALGLVGLSPGRPSRWDDDARRFLPATGDLVDVQIEWSSGGQRSSANGFRWISEIEYARTPISRPWVFGGSQRLPDGSVSADRSGDGIALVDKPDALLALSRGHASRNAELWAAANTPELPPLGAEVWLVFRAAQFRDRRMQIDELGNLFVDGDYAALADGADIVALGRRLSSDYVQGIVADGTLRSDLDALRRVFAAQGVRPEWWRIVRDAKPRGSSEARGTN